MFQKHLITISTCLLLSGCAVGPDYRDPEVVLPEAWPQGIALSSVDLQRDWTSWWQQFNDPVLDALVEEALDNNLEILIQTARVEEYHARLGLARARQMPTLEAQASAAREKVSGAAAGVPGMGSYTGNLFSVSGVLSYELDLWGRLSREREAAQAMLRENQYAKEAVRLSVVADVVTTYFDLRTAETQVRITEDTIHSREETYRLQKIRYEGGDIDELVYEQAKSDLESAKAQLPLQVQRKRMLEGALGMLVGWNPQKIWEMSEWELGEIDAVELPQALPGFLPSELLERRPDIRAAEASLRAATARIGVAEAEGLPRINLATLLGSAATSASDMFSASAETWRLGAAITGPIWDFGRTRSRRETAEALARQSEAVYYLTVNTAFNEVRDALIFHETSRERVESMARLVRSLERTYELAQLRYDEGFIAFFELLDTERNLLAARLSLADAVRDQLTATATLFKTLGGGWEAGEVGSGSDHVPEELDAKFEKPEISD